MITEEQRAREEHFLARLKKYGMVLERPKFPKPCTIISNAAGAAGRVIKAKASGQKVTVSDNERDRRMAICYICEFFTGTSCEKCGCVARWKTKLATEKCPMGKW